MAVSDSDFSALQNRVSQLESKYSTLSTTVNNNGQSINSLSSRMSSAESTIKEHGNTLEEHGKTLQNHEERIKKCENRLSSIEDKTLEYEPVNHYKYEFKWPSQDEQTKEVVVYMPPFSKEELRDYNESMPGLVDFKWYQKIYNPGKQGDVSFDFDDYQGFLKSINLGPHSFISFPLPIKFNKTQDNRQLVIQCCYDNLVCTQQFIRYDVENVVTIFNYSNATINIPTGKPLFRLVPVYGYDVNLQQKSDD